MREGLTAITVRMPIALSDGLKALAKAEGESLNTVMRQIAKRAVAAEGIEPPAGQPVRPIGAREK
jgi:hypothetical protein